MTRAQLEERIAKAIDKTNKKQNTIAKKEKLIAKKTLEASKVADEHDKWSIEYDIKYLNEDIARLHKEIASINATISKYNEQLANVIAVEEMYANEMPEQFKELQNALVKNWDEYDKHRKAYYREKYEELGYKEFFKTFNGADYTLMHTCDEDIHKSNMKTAESMIIDLFNRVKAITGDVTEWSGIAVERGNSFPVLTGVVIGKSGRAYVETILAGGYNIQRLHIRTLVHEA